MNKSMQTGHTIIRTIQMMEVMSYEKQQIAAAACLVAGAIGFAAVYSTQKPGKDEIPTEISQTSSIVEPTEKKTPQKTTEKVDSEKKWDRKNQLQGSRKISSPRKTTAFCPRKCDKLACKGRCAFAVFHGQDGLFPDTRPVSV